VAPTIFRNARLKFSPFIRFMVLSIFSSVYSSSILFVGQVVRISKIGRDRAEHIVQCKLGDGCPYAHGECVEDWLQHFKGGGVQDIDMS
jgi:hypothetical protein